MSAGVVRQKSLRVASGCAMTLGLTLLAFRLHFNLSSATSLHLFLIVWIALRWGFIEASVVSLLSVVCLDYFFTEPLFAFYITDSHDWVAMATFEAVALLVSTLSNQINRHAIEAESNRSQLQKLYELSQQILLLDRDAAMKERLADIVLSSLQVRGVALWNAYDLHLCRSGECGPSDAEVCSTFSTETANDEPLTGTARRVLRAGTRPIGALVLCGHALDPGTIDAAASLVAVAIERSRSFSTEANAEAARQSEQLRAAVLDGLAHAFKSPLTTILASSSGLLAMNTLAGTEKRLVDLIDHHASQLSELASHLLLTAKLDGGDFKLRRERIDLNEVVQESVATSSIELRSHDIEVQLSHRPGLVRADRKLMQMALFQLLDNACKYGLPGSQVDVRVREEESELLVTVANKGSFIPDEEREKIFQRFYRCSESAGSISGTGIGLSVVRRITEAHHGRAWVHSDRVNGTTFTMALPRTAGEE